MAINIKKMPRKFKVNNDGNELILDDPNPELSVDEVMKFYSGRFPDIINSIINGPKIEDDEAVYSFSSSIGKKG